MKSRKGFGKIDINGKKFLFNWANNPDGPMLVMYDKRDRKIEIPFHIWVKYPDSEEYRKRENDVWHGKHKSDYRDWETDRKSTRLNSSHRL